MEVENLGDLASFNTHNFFFYVRLVEFIVFKSDVKNRMCEAVVSVVVVTYSIPGRSPGKG